MVGRIRRKIVAVVIFVVMMPVCMQAMIVTENQARVFSGTIGAVTTLASLCVLRQLPILASVGPVLGGLSYYYSREYTPGQIEKRAKETIDAMNQTDLYGLLSKESNAIDADSVFGAYGMDVLTRLPEDSKKYKSLLRYHRLQFEKAKLNITELEDYHKKIEQINKQLPKCEAPINTLLDLQKKVMDNRDKESTTQNNQKTVEINNQEAKIKWWYMYLDIMQWTYPKFIMGGLAVWFFAWTLKLPYPRFS